MSGEPQPHDRTRRILDQIEAALAFFERELKDDADGAELPAWTQRVEDLRAASQESAGASIALLGESGAGKSTLLNALLGVDLLPHDAGSAVTASVTEIEGGSDCYRIEVRLESASSFLLRFRQICQQLREAYEFGDGGDPAAARLGVDEADISIVRAVTGMDAEELVKHSNAGAEEDRLLPEVRRAMASGEIVAHSFGIDDIDDLRACCRDYLSSRRPLWPFVRRVVIRGPFDLLSTGLRLVDVPGLNDPDPERTRIAQDALQDAQLLWLVLNSKRAMTGSIMQYLTETRLLTKLELEGRLGLLVVVATHADQFDEQGLIDNLELSEDTPLSSLLDHHGKRVRSEVTRSLLRAWDETVAQAGAHVERTTAEAGRARIGSVPFFSVSSIDSLMLRSIWKSRTRIPYCKSDAQTGIPKLIEWMKSEFVGKERAAREERIYRNSIQLHQVIRATLSHREDLKRKLAGLGKSEKGGLKGLQGRAQTFLAERLKEHTLQTAQEVERQAEKLRAAMRAGSDAAEHEIRTHIPERIGGIHWATLRAIARRGGVFFGSTKNWDLPGDIAAAVTKQVVFRWAELFDTASAGFLENVLARCGDYLAQHAQFLYGLLAQTVGEDVPGLERLKQPTMQLEMELDHIRVEVHEKLQTSQMSFERQLVSDLRDRLSPAFARASEERGAGMKGRMVAIICHQLDSIAPELLPALARDLEERVLEVNGILSSQVQHAHRAVLRIAAIEAGNVEAALFRETPESLLAEAQKIAACLRQLEAA